MHSPEDHSSRDDQDLAAPPALADAFRRLPQPTIWVPPAVDSAILIAARRHLAPQTRNRTGRWAFPRWQLATAAGVLLFVGGVVWMCQDKERATPAFTQDLNQDGKVDILDAFWLAKQLQAKPLPPMPDINGDGGVDSRDVHDLAAAAVTLEKRRRS